MLYTHMPYDLLQVLHDDMTYILRLVVAARSFAEDAAEVAALGVALAEAPVGAAGHGDLFVGAADAAQLAFASQT